jgi:hypothetical protein
MSDAAPLLREPPHASSVQARKRTYLVRSAAASCNRDAHPEIFLCNAGVKYFRRSTAQGEGVK